MKHQRSFHFFIYIPVMIVFTFTSCVKETSKPTQTENTTSTTVVANYLTAHGISQNELNGANTSSINQLNTIAETNKLNSSQVKNLFYTYLQQQQLNKQSHPSIPPQNSNSWLLKMNPSLLQRKNSNQSLSCTWGTITDTTKHNGAHWFIQSLPGYNQVTGFTTLPSVGTHSSNDVPYMILGAYTTTGSLCSDAGLYYDRTAGGWFSFENILVWDPVHSAYEQHWSNGATAIGISNPYISYQVTAVTSAVPSYAQLALIIIDPSTWTTISTLSYNVSPNPVSSAYSNLMMTRETSLAQSIENLLNGSYMLHAKWSSVYIYNSSGYSLWDCSKTNIAGKANTPAEWNKITVNSYTPFYEDDVTINYY